MFTQSKKKFMSRWLLIFLALVIPFTLVLSACGGESEKAPAAPDTSEQAEAGAETGAETEAEPEPEQEAEARKTLQEIADEVGEVGEVVDAGSDTVVFVFGETHASNFQRIEIAIMLNRLYATQGVKHFGLEGWIADDPPMDLSWAHQPPSYIPYIPGQPITDREDVLAHMLREGEFTSIEFLGLIYEDVLVHGIEDADLYDPELDLELLRIPYIYLYAIAIETMSDADYESWLDLMDDEDFDSAYDFAMLSTDFTTDATERFNNIPSPEDQLALLKEIAAKAEEVGAEIYPEEAAAMQEMMAFIEVAITRNDVFVESVLDLAKEYPGEPIAIEIGLGHMKGMMEKLPDTGLSYVAIRPVSYLLEEDPSMLSLEAYQHKLDGLSPGGPGTLGFLLNGNMPRLVANTKKIILYTQIMRFMSFAPLYCEDTAKSREKGKEFSYSDLDLNERSDLFDVLLSTWDDFVTNPFLIFPGSHYDKWKLVSVSYEMSKDPETPRDIVVEMTIQNKYIGDEFSFRIKRTGKDMFLITEGVTLETFLHQYFVPLDRIINPRLPILPHGEQSVSTDTVYTIIDVTKK